MDLRYVLLLQFNLFFSFFLPSADSLLDLITTLLQQHHHKHLLTFLFLLLFLCTSIELPVEFGPICLRPSYFSAPLTMLLVLSVFSPSTLFWPPCIFLGILSSYHAKIFQLLRQFLCLCSDTLRSLPTPRGFFRLKLKMLKL